MLANAETDECEMADVAKKCLKENFSNASPNDD